MRAVAVFLTPVALAAMNPAFAQDHSAHQPPTPPAASAPADPHAGHDMAAETSTQSPGPQQSGPDHAADGLYDPTVMARARAQLLREGGGMATTGFFIDRLEATFNDGREGYAWDAQAWHGGDIHRLWWKSEGEGALDDEVDYAELQLLYSRAVTPYFDLQTGLRQSYRPEGDRTDVVIGVQGLAPYWFEVGAEAFLSNKGEFTGRVEAEYDLRLTQRLILQPSAEVSISANDMPEFNIASGVTGIELGARLRYEIRRDVAPYIGVEWESAVGETHDLIETSGEDDEATRLVVGLRAFF